MLKRDAINIVVFITFENKQQIMPSDVETQQSHMYL